MIKNTYGGLPDRKSSIRNLLFRFYYIVCNFLIGYDNLPIRRHFIYFILLSIFVWGATDSVKIFGASPTFVRQEVEDGSNDWYFNNLLQIERSGRQYTEDKIQNLTGTNIGNLQSVTYLSDGKTLNITFWLDGPFFNLSSSSHAPPKDHSPGFYIYIDADSDVKTGWNGIDYINTLTWSESNHQWVNEFSEVSDSGSRLMIETNYTRDIHDNKNIFIPIDLGKMNYPPQYRIVCLAEDWIWDENIETLRRLTDFVNTIHIPPAKFKISFSPPVMQITRGDQNSTEIMAKSVYPLSNIENLQPEISFYSLNKSSDGIMQKFEPNLTSLTADGLAISNLIVKASQNAHTSKLPVRLNISFPSEYFGNPAAVVTETSNITLNIQDPISPMQQIQYAVTTIGTPLGTIATIVTIITGLAGLKIWSSIRKNKTKNGNPDGKAS